MVRWISGLGLALALAAPAAGGCTSSGAQSCEDDWDCLENLGNACDRPVCQGGICGFEAVWFTGPCGEPGFMCQGRECVCPPEHQCDGGCSDVLTDPHHCGACGQDCFGQPCAGGVCQPLVLAEAGFVLDIVVTPTALYWTDNVAVLTAAPDGSGRKNLATATYLAGSIAVDATDVFWSDGTSAEALSGAIYKVPLGGGTSKKLASGLPPLGSLALDATHVYWTECDGGDFIEAAIKKMPKGGGSATTLWTGTSSCVTEIAVGAAYVYATLPKQGRVIRVAKSGASSDVLATGQNYPAAIVVDAGSVYWTNSGAGYGNGKGSVMKMPLSGGTPITLVPDTPPGSSPSRLALDGDWVYWTDAGDEAGAVVRTAKSGGGSERLVEHQPHSGPVAVMGEYVYWATAQAVLRSRLP